MAFGCVKYAQIVVSLGLLRVGLGDFFERVDGFVDLALLGLDHTFHKTPLHGLWGIFPLFLQKLHGTFKLPILDGFFDGLFGQCRVLGLGGKAQSEHAQAQGQNAPAAGQSPNGATPVPKG